MNPCIIDERNQENKGNESGINLLESQIRWINFHQCLFHACCNFEIRRARLVENIDYIEKKFIVREFSLGQIPDLNEVWIVSILGVNVHGLAWIGKNALRKDSE